MYLSLTMIVDMGLLAAMDKIQDVNSIINLLLQANCLKIL